MQHSNTPRRTVAALTLSAALLAAGPLLAAPPPAGEAPAAQAEQTSAARFLLRPLTAAWNRVAAALSPDGGALAVPETGVEEDGTWSLRVLAADNDDPELGPGLDPNGSK